MSWIQKLYETYDSCQAMIGVGTADNEVPLLPICHTTQKAQIEIVLDPEGKFKKARVIPKSEARTIIPCTESSGGRTSGESPHPLCDKLQYIAADYKEYGGNKKAYYKSYLSNLEAWCNSKFSHRKVKAIFEYVKDGTVIKDLVKEKVLIVGSNGKLLKKWDGDSRQKPSIFSLFQNDAWQADAFVRWMVEIPNDPQAAVWTDAELMDSWIQYDSSERENKTLCYVTGQESYLADQHPAKLRNDGDKAKLISSNDLTGFTFRGRFLNDDEARRNKFPINQACGVGFKVTQKAHLALRWLISRQGYRKGDQAIVAWATSGVAIPKLTDDAWAVLGIDDLPTDQLPSMSTAQDLAIRLKKRIAGYGKELGDTSHVVVMGMDSATPGRMSITFYRELTGSDFLQRVNSWHETCQWIHTYRSKEVSDNNGKKRKRHIPFVGAPAPSDIAEAAFGKKIDDKLKKATVERILPCIIDGLSIPRDLVDAVVRRASNRIAMEEWEWNRALSIACALYRKHHTEEDYDMALDPSRKTRDYLYGRLLALADSLEQWALNKAGEGRQTNAARLMQRFAERPYSTWRTIELSLVPYKARLGGQSQKRQALIDSIVDMFSVADFTSDKKLSGEFLLGYHSQREALKFKGENNSDSNQFETATAVNE